MSTKGGNSNNGMRSIRKGKYKYLIQWIYVFACELSLTLNSPKAFLSLQNMNTAKRKQVADVEIRCLAEGCNALCWYATLFCPVTVMQINTTFSCRS